MKRVQMVVEVTASLRGQPVHVQAPKAFRVKGENNHEQIDRVEDAHETEAHDCDPFENGCATLAQASCAKFRTFHQSNATLCPSFSDTLKRQPRIEKIDVHQLHV